MKNLLLILPKPANTRESGIYPKSRGAIPACPQVTCSGQGPRRGGMFAGISANRLGGRGDHKTGAGADAYMGWPVLWSVQMRVPPSTADRPVGERLGLRVRWRAYVAASADAAPLDWNPAVVPVKSSGSRWSLGHWRPTCDLTTSPTDAALTRIGASSTAGARLRL